ncbi:hypothetical protein [Microbacterium sp.]|uniref:hypothetical protein n=1 Tax=Microbacterium sp. TaxID=51671 RepID=UPI003A945F91
MTCSQVMRGMKPMIACSSTAQTPARAITALTSERPAEGKPAHPVSTTPVTASTSAAALNGPGSTPASWIHDRVSEDPGRDDDEESPVQVKKRPRSAWCPSGEQPSGDHGDDRPSRAEEHRRVGAERLRHRPQQ